jgi:hypothetical protein
MDWGYAKPFSIGWWAITPEGRMIRYREWYGCEAGKPNLGLRMGASEVGQRAWSMSIVEGCTDMVADPATWSKVDDAPSIADKFSRAGWTMLKANNDRVSGLAAVHDRLKLNGHDGRPMMLIVDTCVDFGRTLPVLVVDERNPEDLDTKGEDHIYDDVRYACMSPLTKSKPRKALPIVSEGEREDNNIRDYDPLYRQELVKAAYDPLYRN